MIHDAAWLKKNVGELTAAHEAALPNPWTIDAAPDGFIDHMVKAIVGIELVIETLEGKWKASQNRPEADRLGVVAALRQLRTPEADRMAEIVIHTNHLAK